MTPLDLLKRELELKRFLATSRGFSSKKKEALSLIPQYEKAIEILQSSREV